MVKHMNGEQKSMKAWQHDVRLDAHACTGPDLADWHLHAKEVHAINMFRHAALLQQSHAHPGHACFLTEQVVRQLTAHLG